MAPGGVHVCEIQRPAAHVTFKFPSHRQISGLRHLRTAFFNPRVLTARERGVKLQETFTIVPCCWSFLQAYALSVLPRCQRHDCMCLCCLRIIQEVRRVSPAHGPRWLGGRGRSGTGRQRAQTERHIPQSHAAAAESAPQGARSSRRGHARPATAAAAAATLPRHDPHDCLGPPLFLRRLWQKQRGHSSGDSSGRSSSARAIPRERVDDPAAAVTSAVPLVQGRRRLRMSMRKCPRIIRGSGRRLSDGRQLVEGVSPPCRAAATCSSTAAPPAPALAALCACEEGRQHLRLWRRPAHVRLLGQCCLEASEVRCCEAVAAARPEVRVHDACRSSIRQGMRGAWWWRQCAALMPYAPPRGSWRAS